MVFKQLAVITHHIQTAADAATAARALLDIVALVQKPVLVALPNQIFTDDRYPLSPLPKWSHDSRHWHLLKQPQVVHEMLLIPLRAAGSTHGVVGMLGGTDQDVPLFLLADMLAARLEILHAQEQTRRVRALLTQLGRLNSSSGQLQRLIQECYVPLAGQGAILVQFQPEDLRAQVVAQHPNTNSIGQDLGIYDYPLLSQFFTEAPTLIATGQDERLPNRPLRQALTATGLHQLLMAPIFVNGRIVGSLGIGRELPPETHPFTPLEYELVALLAYGIGTTWKRDNVPLEPEQSDNSLFRQVVDVAGVALDISTPDGTVVYRNPAWNRLFGYLPDETPHLQDRLRTEERSILNSVILPAAQVAKGWTGYLTLQRRDQSEFDAHIAMNILQDPHTGNILYTTITDDVTNLQEVMESLEQQTTRLATTLVVSQVIIAGTDLNTLLHNVSEQICVHFHYDAVQVFMPTPDQTKLVCLAAYTPAGSIAPADYEPAISLTQPGIIQQAYRTEKSIIVEDIAAESRFQRNRIAPKAASAAALVLKTSDATTGILFIQSHRRNDFHGGDIETLHSIADQLAIAIAHTRLVTQLQERVQDLAAMTEVSLLVQATFDLDDLKRRVYDAITRVQAPDVFGFAILQAGIIQLTEFTQHGSEHSQLLPGKDLISQLLRQGSPVFWSNAAERAATASYLQVTDYLPGSFLGVPLIAKDRILGGLYARADAEGAFDENDLQLLISLANSTAFALENMQLFEATNRRINELGIINTISHALAQHFGSYEMWQPLIQEMQRLFPGAMIAIGLYDTDRQRLTAPSAAKTGVLILAPPQDLARIVLQRGEALYLRDLHRDTDRLLALGIKPSLYEKSSLRSWLAMPLRSRDNIAVGLIALQSDAPNAFKDDEMALLMMLAAQVSLALDNARLLEAEQQRRQIASSLMDIGRVVSSTLNTDEVFARILEQMALVAEFDRAVIMMPPPEYVGGDKMVIHATAGFTRLYRDAVITYGANSPFMQVYRSQQPLIIPDVKKHAGWLAMNNFLQEDEPRSWLGVPMVYQSHVIGIITIDKFMPHAYVENDARSVFALAHQAAVAVENARLHTRVEDNLRTLEKRARRLTSMHRIASIVNSSLSQEDILDRAAEALTQLFSVDHCGIVRAQPGEKTGFVVAEYPATGMVGQPVIFNNLPAYDDMIRQAISDNMPVFINQENIDELIGENTLARQMLDNAGIRTVLLAPMMAGDYLMGSIGLDSYNPVRVFSKGDRETLMTIARQIAMAIRNSELYAEAVHANQLKNEFLANVSHELRTPLNAIIGYSELLITGMYGDLNDKQLDRLDRVFKSGKNLLELINDILDLSKIEAGRMELDMLRMDIGELARDAATHVLPQAEQKDLAFGIEIAPNLPELEVDGQRIRQVLTNLLSNAVKFTQSGSVTLSVRQAEIIKNMAQDDSTRFTPDIPDGVWLIIAVRDTGIGIRAEDRRLIFDAFRQANGGSTREYEGTGLGLAITEKLVRLHGGHVRLESLVGVGSTFYVLLPTGLPLTTLPNETKELPLPAQSQQAALPVLIVDNSSQDRKLMSEILTAAGYHVQHAPSGETALEWLTTHEVLLVILDVMMPGLSGFEVLVQLRGQRPNLPVIVATAHDLTITQKDILRQHQAHLLQKHRMSSKALIEQVTIALSMIHNDTQF